MSGNRSLDEFTPDEKGVDESEAPGSSTDPSGQRGAPGQADPGPAEGANDPSVEPMAETFAWSGSGAECGSCGASVETRWRDGDRLVCDDCKAW